MKGDTPRSLSASASNTDGNSESTPQVPESNSAKRHLANTRMVVNASDFLRSESDLSGDAVSDS